MHHHYCTYGMPQIFNLNMSNQYFNFQPRCYDQFRPSSKIFMMKRISTQNSWQIFVCYNSLEKSFIVIRCVFTIVLEFLRYNLFQVIINNWNILWKLYIIFIYNIKLIIYRYNESIHKNLEFFLFLKNKTYVYILRMIIWHKYFSYLLFDQLANYRISEFLFYPMLKIKLSMIY